MEAGRLQKIPACQALLLERSGSRHVKKLIEEMDHVDS